MRTLSIDLFPTVCNLCGGNVIYTSNKAIYSKPYGSGMCYLCTSCGAYVGTHVPRPKEAFGILADKQMRELKMQCHSLFDALWMDKPTVKERRLARKKAYSILADKLGIDEDCCHFGYFDTELLCEALTLLCGNLIC